MDIYAKPNATVSQWPAKSLDAVVGDGRWFAGRESVLTT